MSTLNITTNGPTTSCCGPTCCDRERPADIAAVVRERYGSTATSGLSSENAGVRAVSEAFGYSPVDLSSIPAEANMGLSCGNPIATANLRPGEVVVDLGSGGGLDVFLAAQKVGPAGKAIGIDMTPEMIALATRNARKSGLTNVEFHLASIDRMPLPDASADVVISNCVINLAPDKPAVLREIARVLKPGGRLAISDIALKQPLPAAIAKDVAAYVGCVAGALLIEDYRRQLTEAGFADVLVVDSGADLNAYAMVEGQAGCCSPAAPPATGVSQPAPPEASSCCAPAAVANPVTTCCGPAPAPGDATVHAGLAQLLNRYDINDYAASVKVYAVKR